MPRVPPLPKVVRQPLYFIASLSATYSAAGKIWGFAVVLDEIVRSRLMEVAGHKSRDVELARFSFCNGGSPSPSQTYLTLANDTTTFQKQRSRNEESHDTSSEQTID